MAFIEATHDLLHYVTYNDHCNECIQDQVRLLAHDAATPVNRTPNASEPRYYLGFQSWDHKREVILSRLSCIRHDAESCGFFRYSIFKVLWDEVISSAIAEGYPALPDLLNQRDC